jgi:hypothetical protein
MVRLVDVRCINLGKPLTCNCERSIVYRRLTLSPICWFNSSATIVIGAYGEAKATKRKVL